MLEGGELAASFGAEITTALAQLKELAGDHPKISAKGKVTLTLGFEVCAGTVEVRASIDSKLPKPSRGKSFYWLTDDGSISTEHPQQTDMFAGPRGIDRSGAIDV
jgi:hypothetical protein